LNEYAIDLLTEEYNNNMEDTIKKTMEMLNKNIDNSEKAKKDGSNNSENQQQQQQQPENIMAMMQKLFSMSKNNSGEGGEGNDQMLQGLLFNIMETLMSPDILQKPMLELREKYPEWLRENKNKVEEEEYEKVCKQYELCCKICDIYEQSKFPDCMDELTELMTEMQELGQPRKFIYF
jgi:peroxin-19